MSWKYFAQGILAPMIWSCVVGGLAQAQPTASDGHEGADTTAIALRSAADERELLAIVSRSRQRVLTMRDALDRLEPEIVAVAAFLKSRNSASDRNEEAVFTRYPALVLIGIHKGYRFEGFITDAEVLRGRAAEVRRYLGATLECLSSLSDSDGRTASAACRRTFLGCRGEIGADDGGLYWIELTAALDSERVPVRSADQLIPEIYSALPDEAHALIRERAELDLDGCLAVRQFARSWEPDAMRIPQRQQLFGLFRDLTEFKAQCSIPRNQSAEHKRLLALAERFPADEKLTRVIEMSAEWCANAAKRECVHVYPIRDTFALAYVTSGCAVRKVTVRDLEGDVRSWVYATDAEKQEHLILADRISACAGARAAGYTWEYREPTLDSSCRDRSEKRKPAKKPKPGGPVRRAVPTETRI